MRCALKIIVVIFCFGSLAVAAQDSPGDFGGGSQRQYVRETIECDSCVTDQAAIDLVWSNYSDWAVGTIYVANYPRRAVFKVDLVYSGGVSYAYSSSAEPQLLMGFGALFDIFHTDPDFFGGQKSYEASIHLLTRPPGQDRPFSAPGVASDAGERNRMYSAVNLCMGSSVCRSYIDPSLERAHQARSSLSGLTIGVSGGQVGITRQLFEANLDRPAVLKFCGSGGCVHYVYNGWEWVFAGAFTRDGVGYPVQGDPLVEYNYRDGGLVAEGLESAGIPVCGLRRSYGRLICGTVTGGASSRYSCTWDGGEIGDYFAEQPPFC